jgi:hypothetical protein
MEKTVEITSAKIVELAGKAVRTENVEGPQSGTFYRIGVAEALDVLTGSQRRSDEFYSTIRFLEGQPLSHPTI